MRNYLRIPVVVILMLMVTLSCKKSVAPEQQTDEVSQDVVNSVKALGFSTNHIIADEGGYIVEGDIFIPANELKRNLDGGILRVGVSEQYRTTNLVTGLPRTITVALSSRIDAVYGPVLDEVVRRYNAENLQIILQRVSSGANITFDRASGSYLASAGFPTAGGDPYNLIKVNTRAIGSGTSTTFINYAATIFAHELGHCIGFRHTDYMDRSYSCGGSTSNEGASTVGAILIPGTPAGPDPNSFMLACIGSGVNRPFNANDKTALNFLY